MVLFSRFSKLILRNVHVLGGLRARKFPFKKSFCKVKGERLDD